MYVYCNESTHSIFQMSAEGACQNIIVHLQITMKWTQRCNWRSWLSAMGDALASHDCENLEFVIQRDCTCTSEATTIRGCWWQWSKFVGNDSVNVEMHSNAVIVHIRRCTWTRSTWIHGGWDWSRLEMSFGGHDWANLTVVIQWVWQLSSSEHRDALWGCDRASLEIHLETAIERD